MRERPKATVFRCSDGITWIATLTMFGEHHSVHRVGVEDARDAVMARGELLGWDIKDLVWVDITRYGEATHGDLATSAWDILLRAAEKGSGPRDYYSVPWSQAAYADVDALVEAGLVTWLASSSVFPDMNFRATEAGIRAAEAERSRREATHVDP